MPRSGPPQDNSHPQSSRSESTATLLARVRGGDLGARERLLKRYLPLLRRWAHGRLPARARDIADTDDLVQNTLMRALGRLGEFEPRREGAFLSYLRQILLNQIRDEIRRAHRRPERESLKDQVCDEGPSPLDQAVGRETMERYERGLAQLSEDYREAIILRLEFGYSCEEVAEALGRSSANAARQLVGRALVRLAQVLHESE